MTTHVGNHPSAAPPAGGASGWAPHQDMECLVEPRFFCGQLLADDDLTAVVTWARQRLGLARSRSGWGVVCGLEVTAHPDHPSRVVVRPGHAVDPCGEDVVACEPVDYDLTDVCSPPPAHCTGVYQQQPAPERHTAVDLYGYHHAEAAEPQLALAGGTCREPAACEPSRTRRLLALRAEAPPPDGDPVTRDFERWSSGYASAVAFLTQLTGVADLRGLLLRLLDAEPLRDFPFARGLLADTEPNRDSGAFVEVLFWLVQDRRNAVLGRPCPPEGSGGDIPLARIWVDRGENGRGCAVRAVDAAPPYRRPLGPDCWPARLGEVNLGRLVWRRPEEVCVELAALGVAVTDTVPWAPTTLDDLVALVENPPVVACGQPVTVTVFEPGEDRPRLGRRVVAIREAGGQAPGAPEAAAPPAPGGSGQETEQPDPPAGPS